MSNISTMLFRPCYALAKNVNFDAAINKKLVECELFPLNFSDKKIFWCRDSHFLAVAQWVSSSLVEHCLTIILHVTKIFSGVSTICDKLGSFLLVKSCQKCRQLE